MNPTDLPPLGSAPAVPVADADPELAAAVARETGRWSALVAQIGAEIAGPLTDAIERLTAMSATGRIDQAGLRLLRAEVEEARQAGMLSQHLARFASGRVRQSHERVHLTNTLQSVLGHRARELHARGVFLKQSLQPVEVIVDASLLFSLLNTALDWALAATKSMVEVTVDTLPWPVHGRMALRFAHRPLDNYVAALPAEMPPQLNTLTWRLLEQAARTLGVLYERKLESMYVELVLEFPRTVSALVETIEVAPSGEEDMEASTGFSSSVNSKPLAGSHVLVIASRRDVRVPVREAIGQMGLIVDFVGSVEEAAEFCREGLPHAIVIDSAHNGPRFESLMASIREEVPDFVFIEIGEQGREVQISTSAQAGYTRVGREAILTALPSALVYELTRNM